MNSQPLCVLFNRLGPYHHARLNALGSKTALVAIEIRETDSIYAWDKIDEAVDFEKVTLFSGNEVRKWSRSSIINNLHSTLKQLQPRAVAIPGWSEGWALAALRWCNDNGVPAILMSESHSADAPRTWRKEFLKSRVVRLFSSALVGGAPHVDYLLGLGMPRDRIHIGYDVVDNKHFATGADLARSSVAKLRSQKGLPEKFFIACSRFVWPKNLANLCRAYACYRQRAGSEAWKLVLVGDGVVKATLVDMASHLNLGDDMRMVGFKQYSELPIYYGLASAFVLVSTSEPWGLVVNEAMAAGLPLIVSTRCGCAHDLVEEGINGFRVDPENFEEIADVMLKMASQNLALAKMGRASRHIIERWSPEFFAENMLRAEEAGLRSRRAPLNIVDRALIAGLSYR